MPLHDPTDPVTHPTTPPPARTPAPPPRTPLRRAPVATRHRDTHARRRPALAAGLFAGIIVGALTALSWPLGLPADVFVALGAMTGLPLPGVTEAAVVGLLMFAILSALSGLAYAAVLRRTRRSGVGVGALLGIGHAVIVAAALLVGTIVHPDLPNAGGRMWPIGFNLAGLLYFAGLHIVFGAVVGAIAARRHRATRKVAAPTAPDPSHTPPHIPPREIISPNAPPASRVH